MPSRELILSMVRTNDPTLPPEPDASPHPLGPLILRQEMVHGRRSRFLAAVLFAGFVSPFLVAAWLDPDPGGTGTHRQLGLQACSVLQLTGYPCPTCGMTTAFAHTVRGNLPQALRAQPMGVLICLGLLAGSLASLEAAVTGRRWSVNWYRVSPQKAVIVFVLLFAAAWGYKILTVAGAY